MSILTGSSTVVNATRRPRPFGLGLLPGPEADRQSCIWTQDAPWVRDLKAAMRRESYSPCAVNAAVEYAGLNHTVTGCETVEPEDWTPFNRVLSRHFPEAAPAEVPPPAGPTRDELAALDRRGRVFHPGPDDERWLATLYAPAAAVAIRYEDSLSPADLDRMFGRDMDEMLVIGAAG